MCQRSLIILISLNFIPFCFISVIECDLIESDPIAIDIVQAEASSDRTFLTNSISQNSWTEKRNSHQMKIYLFLPFSFTSRKSSDINSLSITSASAHKQPTKRNKIENCLRALFIYFSCWYLVLNFHFSNIFRNNLRSEHKAFFCHISKHVKIFLLLPSVLKNHRCTRTR